MKPLTSTIAIMLFLSGACVNASDQLISVDKRPASLVEILEDIRPALQCVEAETRKVTNETDPFKDLTGFRKLEKRLWGKCFPLIGKPTNAEWAKVGDNQIYDYKLRALKRWSYFSAFKPAKLETRRLGAISEYISCVENHLLADDRFKSKRESEIGQVQADAIFNCRDNQLSIVKAIAGPSKQKSDVNSSDLEIMFASEMVDMNANFLAHRNGWVPPRSNQVTVTTAFPSDSDNSATSKNTNAPNK